MTAMVVAIFAASVLGSLHCAGMCGAFLAVAIGAEPKHGARLQALYHSGRLISYVLLGAAAGAAGGLVNVAGALAGIRPAAAVLAGVTMVFFGVATFLRTRGVNLGRLPLPQRWTRFTQRAHGAAMGLTATSRAFGIGLLTTMLPCGWLYAFAVTAAGTGSPAKGALAMAAFWAGTLPLMVAMGTGLQRVTGAFGRRLPAAMALMLVAVGLYTLVTRTLINPASLAAKVQAVTVERGVSGDSDVCCHE